MHEVSCDGRVDSTAVTLPRPQPHVRDLTQYAQELWKVRQEGMLETPQSSLPSHRPLWAGPFQVLGVPGDWSWRERPSVSEGGSLWYVAPGKEAGPPRGTMLENLGREERVHEGQ